jgi:DNA-binding SARP family transcriptional activator
LNRKGKSILKYLLLHHSKPVPKEVLMECFWPESDQELARNNLNVAIYNLRQTLRKTDPDISYILFKDDCYLFNPEIQLWLDFEVFEKHYQKGKQFEATGHNADAQREFSAAESLYQGELFESDRYEDWPASTRQHLQAAYLYILDRLSQQFLDSGNYTTCEALCQKMLLVDSCREDAHRRLMQCYIRQGHQHLALRQYYLCVEAHKKELDTTPSPETIALFETIRSALLS